jgi:hypothetical protein
VLIHLGGVSRHHGHPGYAALFAGMAALFLAAIVHHAYHREELRNLTARLERTARPPGSGPAAAEDGVDIFVAATLAAACCETWWTSAGAEHDPKHCTRKDHHA